MHRRKYLAALGSLAAGGAAMTGTGAVETISTDRGLSVDVAGDAGAYLGMDANDSSQFVNVNSSGGVLSLDFASDTANGGTGANNDGSTEVRPAFTLKNQGSKTFYVGVNNPLRNNDISTSQTNNTGFAGDVVAPAGVDFQFIASSQAPDFVTQEAGLIDRNQNPQSSSNFGAPSDPRTVPLQAGQSSPYNYIELNKVGYVKLEAGDSVPVTARVVTDGFDVTNDSVPNTNFLVNAVTEESAVRLNNNITSAIGL